MEVIKNNSLPIILVSAESEDLASSLISDIIDNITEASDNVGDSQTNTDKVWRLVNKYYTADVRLHPLGDQQELDPNVVNMIEAHIIYLSPDEAACPARGPRLLERRARAAAGARGPRVLAAAARLEPPALLGAAARARYELVALGAAAPDAGVPRLRDAMHAHVWPAPALGDDGQGDGDSDRDNDSDSDSDGSWSSWRGAPVCRGRGRGRGEDEQFAAALSSLPAAAAAARSTEGRAERLARAEQVLAAFCRALGEPID